MITEAGWTLQALARAVNTAAAETGLPTHYDRTAVSHWLSGTHPRGHIPQLLAEVFSRKLRREITQDELGLRQPGQDNATHRWAEHPDVITNLTRLARTDLDPAGHATLRRLVFQHQKLAVPDWQHATGHTLIPAPREPLSSSVEATAGHAVRRMTHLFALAIRSFGGGHARSALIAYLAHDITTWLRASTHHTSRRHQFPAVIDLVCLAGFTCFDDHAHGLAQRYYHLALALAARAEDPVRYAIALRLLSHQAGHLGHHHAALTLATTALAATGGLACPHTEAFLHAHAAVCHATLGHHHDAHHHLDNAHHQLGRATDPPPTIGAGHAAELAHCTAHVRTLLGDHSGAITALHTALQHYPATDHYRHALTLAQLAHHHLDTGHLHHARTTWHRFQHHYQRLHSTRADTAHTTLHTRLHPFLGGHDHRDVEQLLTRTSTAHAAGLSATTAVPSPTPPTVAASENLHPRKHVPGVAFENVWTTGSQRRKTTSENTKTARSRGPGALPTALTGGHTDVLATYTAALATAPLSAETRRTYGSKVRQYLAWLAVTDTDGDPLTQPQARDRAVRDYRAHLLTMLKRKPATVNNALAAIDDFYTRRGLGPAAAPRLDLPTKAPKSLDQQATLRWLHAVAVHPAPRDRVLALLPFYAGISIGEAVRLDLDDIHLSAHKGLLRIHGTGDKNREIPAHPQLRADLQLWLQERPHWPGATDNPALLLNHHGGRLTTRGASSVFHTITDNAGLDDNTTAHILRHCFATTLIRGGTDLALVAELLGHTRLDTVRVHTQATEEDRLMALDLLPTDH